jgi:uncharacterized protein YqcC (DUF446 family)
MSRAYSPNQRVQLESLLMDLECELRKLSLWRASPPSEQALASTKPFAVDTLSLPEWLQFIFIPKMRVLLEQGVSPPNASSIHAMAEEAFRNSALATSPLLEVLAQIDTALRA